MNQLGTDKFKKKFYEVFGKEDYRYIKNKTYADLKQNPAGQKTIMVFSPTLTDLGRRIFNHIKYEQEKERRNECYRGGKKHKFESRIDQISTFHEVYVCDICVWCGKKIKRNEP